jgi:predicted RNase H-like HicB family nuclease
MHNESTSLIEKHGEWFIGFCPEVHEANGQGKTVEECRENLAEAIALVLLDKREDAFREASANAIRGTITVAA